jgi:transposase InsO family protein
MAGKVIPMRLFASIVALDEGVVVNVTRTCAEAGVSRKTFYKWLARYREGGYEALVERSRRPLRSPGATPAEVEDWVVRQRKELGDAGLDCGAATIQWHLQRAGIDAKVPAVSTMHRILVRRGLVVAQPSKRPKASLRRFEAPAPNECWQIDATGWETLAGPAKVFNIIDDHSRVLIRPMACDGETADNAWAAFCQGASQWGLPARVLSDNGVAFSGKLRGYEAMFEARLRDAGIVPITGRAYHPQTTGKVERFQSTEKQWLTKQPLAADIDELQTQLDRFAVIYNHERPHQGIGRITPISRWQASPAATAAETPIEHPHYSKIPQPHHITIDHDGKARVRQLCIQVGIEHAGRNATIVADDTHATVIIAGQVVRYLTIDPTRKYQPLRPTRHSPPRPHLPT